MASAEQHGRKLKRELSSYLRDQDRAKLRLLRAKINAARVERRHAVTAARGLCRTARTKLKNKQAAERDQVSTWPRCAFVGRLTDEKAP